MLLVIRLHISFLPQEKNDRNSMKDLPGSYHAPLHSKVIMTPNAFMTHDAWLELVPTLCKSLRSMEVICDHPDWWIIVSLDGFGSHVDVHEAHMIFAKNNILIIKEEGDTSQVNQAYDQFVAKEDKKVMFKRLNCVQPILGQAMDQWYLIACAIDAQNSISSDVWIRSFERVNMHPQSRKPFDEWLRILETRGFLSAAKFFDNRHSIYDAMPSC